MTNTNMGMMDLENMVLLTDLYQITMAQGYFQQDVDNEVTFDLFARKCPDKGNYMVAAGLEQALGYLENLSFNEDTIDYLRQQKGANGQQKFSEDFLEYLKDFRFEGDVYAVKEGEVVMPNEPIMRVTADRIQAQLVETFLLNQINHQTLIATKASRVVQAADGRAVSDFGLRRAHSDSAGIKGARAAYIGGAVSTSNVLAGYHFDIPVVGTMAHSWIMGFETELEAFQAYADTYQDSSVLLIDTYDTIEGAKNAVIVGKELEDKGYQLQAIRLDSGDLVDLSIKVRDILDNAGLDYVKIVASNDLNEYKIEDLLEQGAKIDLFGVGTEMITSKQSPALGGVYKLAQNTNKNGESIPVIKLSNDEIKITNPGIKQIYRQNDSNGNYVRDVLGLENEVGIEGEKLLHKVMENGEITYQIPSLQESQQYCRERLEQLGSEHRKIRDSVPYEVVRSDGLELLRNDLMNERRNK